VLAAVENAVQVEPVGEFESVDVSPDGQPADLSVIYKGGDKFLERLRALGNAQHASEEAYRRLQIGTDAKAAYEDAKRVRDEALTSRQEAQTVLDDAKATAAKIIGDANSIKAEADKTKADADKVLQRHEVQLFAAQDRERAALASTQASRQVVAKAEAKEREFQTKIDRLREELRAISADWN
jgi:hypothetical protein